MFRKEGCLNTPEIKILFLSLVYIIAGVFVLARYGESLNSHDEYIARLLSFGSCHLNGNNPNCPPHDSIVDNTSLALNCITFFLLAFIPVTSLAFALNSSDFKKFTKFCKRSKKKPETSQGIISSDKPEKNQNTLNLQTISIS